MLANKDFSQLFLMCQCWHISTSYFFSLCLFLRLFQQRRLVPFTLVGDKVIHAQVSLYSTPAKTARKILSCRIEAGMKTASINQSIGVPSLRRGWRPWCAIRFCQVSSYCTLQYSFSSSRSRCQSNSFFFNLCLFFHPPCPPTLIFVGNDAFLHVHNRPVSFS